MNVPALTSAHERTCKACDLLAAAAADCDEAGAYADREGLNWLLTKAEARRDHIARELDRARHAENKTAGALRNLNRALKASRAAR